MIEGPAAAWINGEGVEFISRARIDIHGRAVPLPCNDLPDDVDTGETGPAVPARPDLAIAGGDSSPLPAPPDPLHDTS